GRGPGEGRGGLRRPARGHVLRVPRRAVRLPPARPDLAWAGPLSIRGGRRSVRGRLPGGRVLRRGRPRLPPLQLRRARRADRPGGGLPPRGIRSHRPRCPVPRAISPIRPRRGGLLIAAAATPFG